MVEITKARILYFIEWVFTFIWIKRTSQRFRFVCITELFKNMKVKSDIDLSSKNNWNRSYKDYLKGKLLTEGDQVFLEE